MSMSLFELDSRIAALEAIPEEDELTYDEETGELMSVIDALEALQMAREEKIENVAMWVKNLMMLASGIRYDVKKQEARARTVEKRIERLKAWLIAANTDKDGHMRRFQTSRVDVQFRTNAASVKVTDEASIPQRFMETRTETVLNKNEIKKALQHGEFVPGAQLERTKSVSVR